MSERWDMIVVGGGIVGCSAAYYAARQGLKPLIIERDSIAAAQSGRALGYVRRQGRDIRELPMMIEAMEIWRTEHPEEASAPKEKKEPKEKKAKKAKVPAKPVNLDDAPEAPPGISGPFSGYLSKIVKNSDGK